MAAPRRARLNKPTVATLALGPGETDVVVWDDELPGFGLRLREGGTKTWIVRYRVGVRSRVQNLGRLAVVDPDAARRAARKVLAARALGEDPAAEKAKARQRAALTFGTVLQTYLEQRIRPRLRPRSVVEVERHLLVHCEPFHAMPVHEVTKPLVAARLAALAKASGPVAANRVRASLSAFFAWSMQTGVVDSHPVAFLPKPGGSEKSRERVLSIGELADIWRATEGPGDFDAILRLLILTGQRRSEVAAMEWSEVDYATATWSLPSGRTKNGTPHIVPLSEPAVAILRGRPVRSGRELVFGEGEGPFSGWSQSKRRLDAKLPKTMAAWTLHDLRRSFVTALNDLGIAPHAVEATVNHQSGAAKAGVAGVYNKSKYLNEKRAAVSLWADALFAEIEGRDRKVIPLRA